MAHRGVLFMDEFCEFHRDVLESLRQPLQDGTIVLTRANKTFKYPANFILVAASNPCPCGYRTHPTKKCVCSISEQNAYLKKLSGPLVDRIDLSVHMGVEEIVNETVFQNTCEDSRKVADRVLQARELQRARFSADCNALNARMKDSDVVKYCNITADCKSFLDSSAKKLDLSMRSYIKILKVSRTIADIANLDGIDLSCVAEALGFRENH